MVPFVTSPLQQVVQPQSGDLYVIVAGVEMGGALKNVLAIACGISDGLGFGNNARAALITRGLVEITRLAVASGAHPMTMGGLAGMGDLVLTCTGMLLYPSHP